MDPIDTDSQAEHLVDGIEFGSDISEEIVSSMLLASREDEHLVVEDLARKHEISAKEVTSHLLKEKSSNVRVLYDKTLQQAPLYR
jgi:hypothetical protein